MMTIVIDQEGNEIQKELEFLHIVDSVLVFEITYNRQ
jgi:hypothetical protein